jgi:hypothetical protein
VLEEHPQAFLLTGELRYFVQKATLVLSARGVVLICAPNSNVSGRLGLASATGTGRKRSGRPSLPKAKSCSVQGLCIISTLRKNTVFRQYGRHGTPDAQATGCLPA